ncbi:transposon Tf2-9 polyprotein [Trichonephila clavipes]|uniref:Transposon Tf2-9 polyprotein n=1 Tax=Trichonephila clavipes TaxID=2585209 RepID=A0A8X6R3E3_TRICX|nr:transposon Tf2-9 polyprotein [Trichonephila clavipes]
MAEVTAVKIPPYNFSDPQLWFSTCERTFALGVPKAITDTCTKFIYIVSNLPPETAAIVRDLIIPPDETDPYDAIKAQLILRTGDFAQRSERVYVGTFSSAATDLSANYLGIHANNRRESHRSRRQNPRSEHSQRFTFDTNTIASANESRILQEIERLHKRIDDLTMHQRTPERRNNSRSQNRSRNRSFSRSRESGRVVGITESFKKGPRNAFHPAAIKKNNPARSIIATTFSRPHISRHLFIKDKSSNIAFLIDTGSDVSVLPASISEKRKGDSIQQLSAANTSSINVYIHSIKLVSGESIFHDVLREFPEIVKPPSFSQEVKHNVKHLIETSGPPVFAKARRLAPDRLKTAKSEFQHMLN